MARREENKQTGKLWSKKSAKHESKAKRIVPQVTCEETYVACLFRTATAHSSFASWDTDKPRADRVYYQVTQGPRQNDQRTAG
jgi:hypothetical protein